MKVIPVTEFGKDHWSLLGYIETVCVDSPTAPGGELDHSCLRCNPEMRAPVGRRPGQEGWRPKYGTRTKSFPWTASDEDKLAFLVEQGLDQHDDWHCLDDLEKAGFVVLLSYVNGFVSMTDLGLKVAAELRAHKAKGGNFADFDWSGATDGS